ncbi:MAG: 30S ribosomal protein S9 [Proteobacteria bacterium]|nr:30S ribosomal protein S9 [Pseudomonadota bacterium]
MAKNENKNLIITSGRRKTATASVFMTSEKGTISVNEKPIENYFPSEKENLIWRKPFFLLGIANPEAKYNLSIKVKGSSKSSQLGAVTLAISKALSKLNEEFSVLLKKNGMLTRDPRMVERKKPNLRKARKASQFSKR